MALLDPIRSDPSGGDRPGPLDRFSGNQVQVLQEFASAPGGFILGIVLAQLLSGLETAVVTVVDGILIVFRGTEPGTQGRLGIADVPLKLFELLIKVGNALGEPLVAELGNIVSGSVDLAAEAGALGLVLIALALVAVAVVLAGSLRNLVEIVVDVIPGGGALIN